MILSLDLHMYIYVFTIYIYIYIYVCSYVRTYMHTRNTVCTIMHLCTIRSYVASICSYVCTLLHKQIYWIRTNLQSFQPSNVKCNIRMSILCKMIMYFGNFCSPCPLHWQNLRRLKITFVYALMYMYDIAVITT